LKVYIDFPKVQFIFVAWIIAHEIGHIVTNVSFIFLGKLWREGWAEFCDLFTMKEIDQRTYEYLLKYTYVVVGILYKYTEKWS